MAQDTRIRIRRGLSSARTSITPESGELLYTTDDQRLWAGDGTTAGGNPILSAGLLETTLNTVPTNVPDNSIVRTASRVWMMTAAAKGLVLGTTPANGTSFEVQGNVTSPGTVDLSISNLRVGGNPAGATTVTVLYEGNVYVTHSGTANEGTITLTADTSITGVTGTIPAANYTYHGVGTRANAISDDDSFLVQQRLPDATNSIELTDGGSVNSHVELTDTAQTAEVGDLVTDNERVWEMIARSTTLTLSAPPQADVNAILLTEGDIRPEIPERPQPTLASGTLGDVDYNLEVGQSRPIPTSFSDHWTGPFSNVLRPPATRANAPKTNNNDRSPHIFRGNSSTEVTIQFQRGVVGQPTLANLRLYFPDNSWIYLPAANQRDLDPSDNSTLLPATSASAFKIDSVASVAAGGEGFTVTFNVTLSYDNFKGYSFHLNRYFNDLEVYPEAEWAVSTAASNFTGATAGAPGTAGLVPAPAAGDQTDFLRGDGTWAAAGGSTQFPLWTASTAYPVGSRFRTDASATFPAAYQNKLYRVNTAINASQTTFNATVQSSIDYTEGSVEYHETATEEAVFRIENNNTIDMTAETTVTFNTSTTQNASITGTIIEDWRLSATTQQGVFEVVSTVEGDGIIHVGSYIGRAVNLTASDAYLSFKLYKGNTAAEAAGTTKEVTGVNQAPIAIIPNNGEAFSGAPTAITFPLDADNPFMRLVYSFENVTGTNPAFAYDAASNSDIAELTGNNAEFTLTGNIETSKTYDLVATGNRTAQLVERKDSNNTTVSVNDTTITNPNFDDQATTVTGRVDFDVPANTSNVQATIPANAITPTELNIVGNGTSGQVLSSDGDGSFSWIEDVTYQSFSSSTSTLRMGNPNWQVTNGDQLLPITSLETGAIVTSFNSNIAAFQIADNVTEFNIDMGTLQLTQFQGQQTFNLVLQSSATATGTFADTTFSSGSVVFDTTETIHPHIAVTGRSAGDDRWYRIVKRGSASSTPTPVLSADFTSNGSIRGNAAADAALTIQGDLANEPANQRLVLSRTGANEVTLVHEGSTDNGNISYLERTDSPTHFEIGGFDIATSANGFYHAAFNVLPTGGFIDAVNLGLGTFEIDTDITDPFTVDFGSYQWENVSGSYNLQFTVQTGGASLTATTGWSTATGGNSATTAISGANTYTLHPRATVTPGTSRFFRLGITISNLSGTFNAHLAGGADASITGSAYNRAPLQIAGDVADTTENVGQRYILAKDSANQLHLVHPDLPPDPEEVAMALSNTPSSTQTARIDTSWFDYPGATANSGNSGQRLLGTTYSLVRTAANPQANPTGPSNARNNAFFTAFGLNTQGVGFYQNITGTADFTAANSLIIGDAGASAVATNFAEGDTVYIRCTNGTSIPRVVDALGVPPTGGTLNTFSDPGTRMGFIWTGSAGGSDAFIVFRITGWGYFGTAAANDIVYRVVLVLSNGHYFGNGFGLGQQGVESYNPGQFSGLNYNLSNGFFPPASGGTNSVATLADLGVDATASELNQLEGTSFTGSNLTDTNLTGNAKVGEENTFTRANTFEGNVTLGNGSDDDIVINGGTRIDNLEQVSNNAAAQGDIIYRGSSIYNQLNIGRYGQGLTVNSGGNTPEWSFNTLIQGTSFPTLTSSDVGFLFLATSPVVQTNVRQRVTAGTARAEVSVTQLTTYDTTNNLRQLEFSHAPQDFNDWTLPSASQLQILAVDTNGYLAGGIAPAGYSTGSTIVSPGRDTGLYRGNSIGGSPDVGPLAQVVTYGAAQPNNNRRMWTPNNTTSASTGNFRNALNGRRFALEYIGDVTYPIGIYRYDGSSGTDVNAPANWTRLLT